jgi:hypothetical protein
MRHSNPYALAASIFFCVCAAQAQHSGWIERKQVEQIRKSLQRYYSECGFYPEKLDNLFEITANEKSCRSSGVKGANKWPAPLKDSSENREAVASLQYTPYGYHDYELSIRLLWTRDQ